jgi:hypothetical protein
MGYSNMSNFLNKDLAPLNLNVGWMPYYKRIILSKLE